MSDEKTRIEMAKESLLRTLETRILENIECVSVEELTAVTDAIKDMAEADKYCNESKYYKAVVEAMEEHGEEPQERQMYYNPSYYKMGYNPVTSPYFSNAWRMDSPDTDRMPPIDNDTSRYGQAFSEYRRARKNYTETHSDAAKSDMDAMATKHLSNAMASLREMWNGADDSLKIKIKSDLSRLIGEMAI